MSCCTDPKNHAPYAAEVPSGIAIACKKCGRARPATAQEAENARAVGEEQA